MKNSLVHRKLPRPAVSLVSHYPVISRVARRMLLTVLLNSVLGFSTPVVPQDFASANSWDDAYAAPGGTEAADWLLPYDGKSSPLKGALQDALLPVQRRSPVLELGSGTSELASQLICDLGFRDVLGSDLSGVAVQAARDAPHNTRAMAVAGAKLSFDVVDARSTGFPVGSFAAVVDKGTLDAICTSDGFDYEAGLMSAEVARILEPGGRWVSISLLPGRVIIPFLERAEWESIGTRTIATASGASGGSVIHMHVAVRAQPS